MKCWYNGALFSRAPCDTLNLWHISAIYAAWVRSSSHTIRITRLYGFFFGYIPKWMSQICNVDKVLVVRCYCMWKYRVSSRHFVTLVSQGGGGGRDTYALPLHVTPHGCNIWMSSTQRNHSTRRGNNCRMQTLHPRTNPLEKSTGLSKKKPG